jgi:hypothetical protein
MQMKSDLNIWNRVISKQSRLSGLVKAEEDSSGKIIFKSLFDNYESARIEDVAGHVEKLGINDLRVFNEAGEAVLGTRRGLTQVADDAKNISNRIRNADPATKDLLNKLNLGFLFDADSEIGMTYAHFDHAGKAQNLKSLLNNELVQNAGILNITDDGMTVINYRAGKRLLTAAESKDLQYALGVGKITPSFTKKVMEDSDAGFGKLPKRLQGLLSARDISIGGADLGDLKSKTYIYDDVELFFKSIFNAENVSGVDRYLMSAGLDMTEGERRRLMNAVAGDSAGGTQLLQKYKSSLIDKLEQMSPNLTRSNVLNDLQLMYRNSGENVAGLKSEADKIIKSSLATEEEIAFARRIQAAIEGVEKMRDGEFIGTVNFLKRQKNILLQRKQDLIDIPGLKTEEDLLQIKIVQDEIEGLESMIEKRLGTSKAKSSIARIFYEDGGLKGEMAVVSNNMLPTELRDKHIIAPLSAFKKEVRHTEPLVLFNVAKKSKDIVYTDPLMIAYDPAYMNSPEFKEALQQNVRKQISAIEDFQRTGALPEETRKAIFGAIDEELSFGLSEDAMVKNLGVKFSDLTPGAKSSMLRNRREAETISQLMKSGADPRDIPALVRRINDYYATQAFRLKGNRVDLAMPDAMRMSLRTYESSLASGKNVATHEQVMVNVSRELAGSSQARAMGVSSGAGQANFVQFQLEGKRMLLSGPNAELYHHALGTFDLDDSGVPIMTTFKDARGNDRMAFMTYRQPTGAQEKIFMQADLTHNQTLKTILEKSSGDFQSLMNDPSAIYSLSQKERQILGQVQKVLDGDQKINLRNSGYSSADVEQVLIKLRNSHGQNHGFTTLMKISQADLDEMVVTKSSSALGIDKVMAHLQTGAITHGEFMESFGVKPNAAPMYSRGNFLNLIAETADKEANAKLVEIFNQSMADQPGYTPKATRAEIQALANTSDVAKVRMESAVDQLADAMKRSAIPNVDDTLGLYINRQATAVAMSGQVDQILANQLAGEMIDVTLSDGIPRRIPLQDYVKMKYSSALIPPSEAVDAEKALLSALQLRPDEMKARMAQMDVINAAQRQFAGGLQSALDQGVMVSEEAAQTVYEDLVAKLGQNVDGTIDVRLGGAGEHALDQSNKSIGFIRARQIAKQIRETGVIDEGSLAGYDPALISNDPYGRIKGKDSERIIKDFINEMEQGKIGLTDSREIAAIDSAIAEMRTMSVVDALERVKLKEGTVAYKAYAGTAEIQEIAGISRERFEGASALGQKRARLATDRFAPTPKAQYMESVDQLIESQKAQLDFVSDITKNMDQLSPEVAAFKNYHQMKINASFYEGMSAIALETPGANILDINDTLESALTSRYGRGIAGGILNSELPIEDVEGGMQELQSKSRARRIANYNLQTADKDAAEAVQRRFNTISGRTDLSLAQVTRDQAEQYLDYVKSLSDSERRLGMGFDQDVFDFMTYKTGGASSVMNAEGEAFEAFRYFDAEGTLSELADEYTSGAMDDLLMPADDISDSMKRVVAADADVLDSGSAASRGAYTRVQDFMDSPALRQVFENPTIRRGAMGLAALAVFGFVYSARKDRTADEMSGPPLLPGGSAYESDMPKYVPSLSNLKYLNPVVAGMQYKINVNGSQKDIEKMQSLAEGVVDGPVNSTMYNSLPRLGKDPYQNVASRF